jgi:predicted phage tail protein
MQTIRLYGHLGKTFGREFKFDVRTPAEAIAALRANLEGFTAYLARFSKPGFHILVEKRSIGEAELAMPQGRGTIKIIPAVAGAKNGGVLQTVAGIALIVAGVIFENPYMISSGIAMTAGGVIAMLTRVPNGSSGEKVENMPSYNFNGAVNTTAQGNPVPICYGEMIVGSQVVSFGLSIEDIYAPVYGPGGGGDGGGSYYPGGDYGGTDINNMFDGGGSGFESPSDWGGGGGAIWTDQFEMVNQE